MKKSALVLALILSASTLFAASPPRITDATLIDGCEFSARCPWFLWDPVNGATHYTIYRNGVWLADTPYRFFTDATAGPNEIITYNVTARRLMKNKPAAESQPSQPLVIWNDQVGGSGD